MADPTISHGWTTSEPDDPEKDVSADNLNDHHITGFGAAVSAIVDPAVATEAALARNADNLSSGTVADARIASTIARDSEVTSAVSTHAGATDPHGDRAFATAADATHAGAADPHPGYLTAAEGAAAFDAIGAATAVAAAAVLDGDAAGGQLTGTFPNPSVAASHSGSTHAAAQAAAEATAAAALAAHEADTTSVHGIADTSALYRSGGTDVAVADGGTGASTAAGARTNLGLVIGTDVEAKDADLTTIAGLTPSNDDIIQRKAGGWTNRTIAQYLADLGLGSTYQPLDADLTALAALTTTSYGRSLLEAANAAALRSLAASVIGTDVEAHDADLTTIAGLTPSNDDLLQRKAGAWANRTIAQLLSDLAAAGTTFQPLDSDLTSIAALTTTSFGRSLLALADAAALSAAHTHSGGASLTTFMEQLTGNVSTTPVNTYVDILTHSCAAGTWDIQATITVDHAGPSDVTFRLHDGTGVVAETEFTAPNNIDYLTSVNLRAIVTLAGTATVSLRAAQNFLGNGTSIVLATAPYNGTTNKATTMVGVKTA